MTLVLVKAMVDLGFIGDLLKLSLRLLMSHLGQEGAHRRQELSLLVVLERVEGVVG